MSKLDELKDKDLVRDKSQCNLRIDKDVRDMLNELKVRSNKDVLAHLRSLVSAEIKNLYSDFKNVG